MGHARADPVLQPGREKDEPAVARFDLVVAPIDPQLGFRGDVESPGLRPRIPEPDRVRGCVDIEVEGAAEEAVGVLVHFEVVASQQCGGPAALQSQFQRRPVPEGTHIVSGAPSEKRHQISELRALVEAIVGLALRRAELPLTFSDGLGNGRSPGGGVAIEPVVLEHPDDRRE